MSDVENADPTVREWATKKEFRNIARSDAAGDISERGEKWWVSLLDPAVLRTTRGEIPGIRAIAELCPDDHIVPLDEPVAIWHVHPLAKDTHVYEVLSGADWVALVDRYPVDVSSSRGRLWNLLSGMNSPWVMPDYARLSDQWDGVHISVAGFLSSAYTPLETAHGMTYLAGWNPDETLWLGRDNEEYHWARV